MVRLQPNTANHKPRNLRQSQFHYGSITTTLIYYLILAILGSLNSTMVRLQPLDLSEYTDPEKVSIPLWFDYN